MLCCYVCMQVYCKTNVVIFDENSECNVIITSFLPTERIEVFEGMRERLPVGAANEQEESSFTYESI